MKLLECLKTMLNDTGGIKGTEEAHEITRYSNNYYLNSQGSHI